VSTSSSIQVEGSGSGMEQTVFHACLACLTVSNLIQLIQIARRIPWRSRIHLSYCNLLFCLSAIASIVACRYFPHLSHCILLFFLSAYATISAYAAIVAFKVIYIHGI
jgi:hypothetical protein